MPMTMRLQPEAEYLHVEFSGTFALGEAQTLSVQFLEACREHGLTKVLVDTRPLAGALSLTERFHYADFVSREIINAVLLARLKPLQLAYVGAAPIIDPDKFGVVVAANRGVNATTTSTVDEGLAWLGVARPGG